MLKDRIKTQTDNPHQDLFDQLRRSSLEGKTYEAIEAGRLYVLRRPTHTPGWLFYGQNLVVAGRYAEALSAYRNGLQHCPAARRCSFYLQIAFLHEKRGEYRKAELSYLKAIQLAPPENEIILHYGAMLLKQGRLADAQTAFELAIENDNEIREEAYYHLAKIHATRGEFFRARAAIESALKEDPENDQYLQFLVDIREALRLQHAND